MFLRYLPAPKKKEIPVIAAVYSYKNATDNGHSIAYIRTVDTDVVVSCLPFFLQRHLFKSFG